MRQHLVFVASPRQLELVRDALQRLNASALDSSGPLPQSYEFTHPLLGKMPVQVNLISDLDALSLHLRQHPVDLLIYDERGPDGIEAVSALQKIRRDVQALADLWGPDFLFPMSRVVAILADRGKSRRVFEMGRMNVRDVCLAPKNVVEVLVWLKDILWHGILREEKIGMAMGGGGIEGFLYQLGVMYALDQAIEGERGLRGCSVISGVSSGAISGTLFASKLPLIEIIKSLDDKSELIPPLTSSTIFDLAATDISKRVIKQSLAWKGLDPRKWFETTLKSIPSGFFRGDRLEEYFRIILAAAGHEDHFDQIKAELLIGVTDHDTYEHVILGRPPWDQVPISAAIRASAAMPPIFAPKMISGRSFIDGQVTRSCNLEVVVESGCRMVVVINPLKPFSSHIPGFSESEGGLYTVIQTIKALISTRFDSALRHAADRFPDVDFIVFEPSEECAEVMAGSPMRYRIRKKIVHLAYHGTMKKLRERHSVYAAKMAKYGLNLRAPGDLKEMQTIYDQIFNTTDSS